MAGRLTKLPSIRGPAFASRRPAEVGLAGIASSRSVPSASHLFPTSVVQVQELALICLAPSISSRCEIKE